MEAQMNGDIKKKGSISSSIDKSIIAQQEEEANDRGAWGGQIEFFLTCVGYAVGLGNVWRFPYLAYQNGGGAFLIPYFICLFIIGLPMYGMELAFGQFSSLGPLSIWKVSPVFKGVGFAAITVTTYIVIYFNVIVAWCLYFLFSSFQDPLPWTNCNHTWSAENCMIITKDSTYNETIDGPVISPSEDFFYNHVLQVTDGIEDAGSIRWQLMLLLFTSWVIVYLVLIKGIQSLGKASYVISLFPYVLLTAMLIRGATLEGAQKGIEYYITPQWDRLTDLRVWGDAAVQIFYSTGVCMGSLIAMSSFNSFKNNTIRDSILIPLINCGTSLYTGFVIFSVIGFMAESKGVEVEEVATQGPGLVFVVYPEGLATMPIPQLWSVLFFIMMTLIGYSSQFSMCESIISAIMDEFPDTLRSGNRPMVFRACFCLMCFLLGFPLITQGGYYMFTILNDYSSSYPLLVIGIFELLVIQYVYGYSRFVEDIALMVGRKPPMYFAVCWRFLTPVLVTATFIFLASQQGGLSVQMVNKTVEYPGWGSALAWIIAMFPISCIFIYMLYYYCSHGGAQVCGQVAKPRPDWGPAKVSNRQGLYAEQELLRKDTQLQTLEPFENYAFVVEKGQLNTVTAGQVPYYTGNQI